MTLTTKAVDSFSLLLKSASTNPATYMMASELAKAYFVPVLVGVWPALSMGQLMRAALDRVAPT